MQNNQPLIPGPSEESVGQQNQKDFYRAFEDKFRGSRELILSRLQVYLPFVNPLKQIYPVVPAVDLGCGRGEWLELLKEHGFEGQGVDLDAGMLRSCHERGLQAIQGDAIEFLRQLPSESQLIISGFHIAEHLPFEQLQTLVAEAFRVLRPAGLLILETPNPENFKVSSVGFYMDPSHRNPLPPELLAFVPAHYGFARVKIIRLQENPALLYAKHVSLDQVLGGASPDYAVVAQKQADVSFMDTFNDAFEREYGLPVSELLDCYDKSEARLEEQIRKLFEERKRIDSMQGEIEKLHEARLQNEEQARFQYEEQTRLFAEDEARIVELDERVSRLEEEGQRLEQLINRLGGMQTAIEHVHERLAFADNVHAALLESLNRERALDAKLQQVLQSRSWRITGGLRLFARVLRAVAQRGSTPGIRSKAALVRLIVAATNRPQFRRIGGMLLSITPKFKARMVRVVIGNSDPETPPHRSPTTTADECAHLPNRARVVRSMLDQIMKSS
jgi:O-antigen chain-terminating methyltransferase